MRSQQSLVGEYVEQRATVEENFRVEEHNSRNEIFALEKQAAQDSQRNINEQHRLNLRCIAMEAERKKRILDLDIEAAEKRNKLLDIEIKTAEYKRDLALKQLGLQ